MVAESGGRPGVVGDGVVGQLTVGNKTAGKWSDAFAKQNCEPRDAWRAAFENRPLLTPEVLKARLRVIGLTHERQANEIVDALLLISAKIEIPRLRNSVYRELWINEILGGLSAETSAYIAVRIAIDRLLQSICLMNDGVTLPVVYDTQGRSVGLNVDGSISASQIAAGGVSASRIAAGDHQSTSTVKDPLDMIPPPRQIDGNPFVLVNRTQLMDILVHWQLQMVGNVDTAKARAEVIFNALIVAYPREE